MQKLLLFILVLVAIYYVRRYLQNESSGTSEKPSHETPRSLQAEVMRECSVCGLLVPESEAEQKQGRFYCCREHAQQAESGGRN